MCLIKEGAQMSSALAHTKIYTASDGNHYVCIALTDNVPDDNNVKTFYEIIDYIPTLGKRFIVIVDARSADLWKYMSIIPVFLKKLHKTSGVCVIRAEVWIKKGVSSVAIPMIQPLFDTILCSGKISIKCV
jgi:hypothetical protein